MFAVIEGRFAIRQIGSTDEGKQMMIFWKWGKSCILFIKNFEANRKRDWYSLWRYKIVSFDAGANRDVCRTAQFLNWRTQGSNILVQEIVYLCALLGSPFFFAASNDW